MSRRAESRMPIPFPISGVLVRNPEGYTVSTLSSVTDTLLRAGGAGLLYDPRGTTDDGDARVVHALCRGFNVPFLVVDDVELARRQRADGLYLTAPKADVGAARTQLPWAAVGLFCGLDVDAAKRAVEGGAAYVAFGLADTTSDSADDSAAQLGPGDRQARADLPEARTASVHRDGECVEVIARARANLRVPIVADGDLSALAAGELVRRGADVLALSGVVYGAEHPRQVMLAYLACFPPRDDLRAGGARPGR